MNTSADGIVLYIPYILLQSSLASTLAGEAVSETLLLEHYCSHYDADAALVCIDELSLQHRVSAVLSGLSWTGPLQAAFGLSGG